MKKEMQTGVQAYGVWKDLRYAPRGGCVYHPQASSPRRREETLIPGAQKCIVYSGGGV